MPATGKPKRTKFNADIVLTQLFSAFNFILN